MGSVVEILEEGRNFVKGKIRTVVQDGNSKYIIYLKINPNLNLEPSPFLYIVHPMVSDIIRFCVGSHYLPIETGRWTPKDGR